MLMARLNPGVLQKKLARKNAHAKDTEEGKLVQAKKKARLSASKAHNKKFKSGDATFYKTLMKAFESKAAAKDADNEEE
jgi:hypothetical protein